jgi:molecular chaperone GrpE (heat shock protein)
MNTSANGAGRRYRRRNAEETIAALEQQISDLKSRQVDKERKEDPVLREIPRIQRRLRKFAQLAMDRQRADIANSVTAFVAGLERILSSERAESRRRERVASDE